MSMPRTFAAYDPSRPLVAGRRQTVHGEELNAGDPYPTDKAGEQLIPEGTRRRLWMTHWAHYAEEARPTPVEGAPRGAGGDVSSAGEASPVSFSHTGGGYYEIIAPWLEEPERVKGKAAAEKRAKALSDAGPPAKEDAPAAPPTAAAEGEGKQEDGTLQPLEGNDRFVLCSVEGDKFVVNCAWLEEPEEFTDGDEADARVAELRAEGPPEGWEPPADAPGDPPAEGGAAGGTTGE